MCVCACVRVCAHACVCIYTCRDLCHLFVHSYFLFTAHLYTCLLQGDLVACGVLSGNRNFEGRINPHTRANYLASPPLCIAYAIAGTVHIDMEKEPLGMENDILYDINFGEGNCDKNEDWSVKENGIISMHDQLKFKF